VNDRQIVLYGEPRSRAFRCIWMLEELGLDFQLVPVRFGGVETRAPEFLALNPNGRVPALVDGTLVLYESLAINHYLTSRYGTGSLEPSTPNGRAEALRWSFWAMGEIEGPVDAVARHAARLADGWAAGALGVLDAALTGVDWLVESRFTVADLNVAVMFRRPLLARVDRAPWPRLAAWIERCEARPACQRMAARFGG
jgi:glutathione S-transferase